MNPNLIVEVVSAVYDEFRAVASLRKVSSGKLHRFAIDFSLVTLSVRCAYLVDVISLKEPVRDFSLALQRLRDKNSSQFGRITHYKHRTTFVKLEDTPVVLSDPPDDLHRALDEIHSSIQSQNALSTMLPSHLTQQTLICLAGVLIGYPVVYVPRSSDQALFLSDVPLDIYEIVINLDDTISSGLKYHTVLKFTCPSAIASDLRDLTATRLSRSICARSEGLGLTPTIHHHVDTFDRVAL